MPFSNIHRLMHDDPRQSSLAPLLEVNRRFHAVRDLATRFLQLEACDRFSFRLDGLLGDIERLLHESFRAEEALLRSLDYYGFERHREDHRRMAAELERLRAEAFLGVYPAGTPPLGRTLVHFIGHHYTFDDVFLLDGLQTERRARVPAPAG